MGPIAYSLCHKPVVGLLMFVASACAFPPLFQDAPLALQQAGASVVREVDAPVGKTYSLALNFQFPSGGAGGARDVVGSTYNHNCERAYADIPPAQRQELGRPIPIQVRGREVRTGTVTLDQVFTTLCMTSSGAGFVRTRTAASIQLAAGKHRIEVSNLERQDGLDGVKTTLSLVSGDRK